MVDNFITQVLAIVKKIPKGQTMSYGAVAALAGRPRAARVVGLIMSKNFDPSIPCHRVICANGKVGGYNRGSDLKLKLLQSEQAL